jgi:hypothetical protein
MKRLLQAVEEEFLWDFNVFNESFSFVGGESCGIYFNFEAEAIDDIDLCWC